MKSHNHIMAIALALTILLVGSARGSAATPPTGGVTVSPVIKQLQLTAGQNSADFDLSITNHTPAAVQVKISFADFKALNDSGGIAFLGEEATALKMSHGLTNWVHVETQQVGLNSGQSTGVAVHLDDLNSLSAGGHYGAVIYQVLKPAGGQGNRVDINQALSSLIFVTTAGGGTQHLSMPSPHLSGFQYAIPSSLNLYFTNDGNTQTTPRGSLTIDGGKAKPTIATGVINPDSALVLPGSTRVLPTPLTALGRPWWPHQYHVNIRYRSDNATTFSTYNAAFLYINPWLLVVLPVVGVVSWYVLRWLLRNPRKAVAGLRTVYGHPAKAARAIHRKARSKRGH